MTKDQIVELKRHFLEWSGGFEPESEHQITVYVDYGRSSELDSEETRRVLTKWMNAGSPSAAPDDSAGR